MNALALSETERNGEHQVPFARQPIRSGIRLGPLGEIARFVFRGPMAARAAVASMRAERDGMEAAYLAVARDRASLRAAIAALADERDQAVRASVATIDERDAACRDAGRWRDRCASLDEACRGLSAELSALKAEARLLNVPLEPLAAGAEGSLPSALIVTLPKSGTVFIQAKLHYTYGLARRNVCAGRFPGDVLDRAALDVLSRGGRIAMSHAPASAANLAALDAAGIRFCVHLRDPRAATLSMLHHMRNYFADPVLRPYVYRVGVALPPGFFEAPFDIQLDAMLERYLPEAVSWIEGWRNAFESDEAIRSAGMLTRYEMLARSGDGLIEDIRSHLGLPATDGRFPHVERDAAAHFRNGDDGEWVRVFSPSQRRVADALVPRAMRQAMGWP